MNHIFHNQHNYSFPEIKVSRSLQLLLLLDIYKIKKIRVVLIQTSGRMYLLYSPHAI